MDSSRRKRRTYNIGSSACSPVTYTTSTDAAPKCLHEFIIKTDFDSKTCPRQLIIITKTKKYLDRLSLLTLAVEGKHENESNQNVEH